MVDSFEDWLVGCLVFVTKVWGVNYFNINCHIAVKLGIRG